MIYSSYLSPWDLHVDVQETDVVLIPSLLLYRMFMVSAKCQVIVFHSSSLVSTYINDSIKNNKCCKLGYSPGVMDNDTEIEYGQPISHSLAHKR